MFADKLGQSGGIQVTSLPGKSVFDQNRYARRVPMEAAADPQLLLLPGWRPALDLWGKEVPGRLWERAAGGHMRVVIDVSGEGNEHDPEETDGFHRFFGARGIPMTSVSYITQDRGYPEAYQAWCTEQGFGDRAMAIHFADFFLRRFFLELEARGQTLYADRLGRFRARQAQRERRLISLNLSPRESKVLFLLRLMRDGFWDQAFVSFGGIGMNRRGKKPAYKLWREEVAALDPYLCRLEAMGRLVFGEDSDNTSSQYRTPVYDAELPQHDASWFTVVSETEMRSRPSRITEKACKPLVNFHPFIFLGNPGSLAIVREYGFQTFEGFFDELYDAERDVHRRFDHVYEQVAVLCRASEAELGRRTSEIEDALVHNAHWGLTKLPAALRSEGDLELLTAVLRGNGRGNLAFPSQAPRA